MAGSPHREEDPGQPAHETRRFGLVLPSGVAEEVPAGSLVRRAVSWVVLMLACLLAIALVVMTQLQFDVTIQGHGLLEPVDLWRVRARESGTVLAVHVSTGDTVATGRLLLELDPFDHRQTLAELEAQWRQRRLEHEKALAMQPSELAHLRERVAMAQASLVDARAELRGQLVERGLRPNVDSVLEHYVLESSVALDVAVSAVRRAAAEVSGELARLEELKLAGLDRRREEAGLDGLERQMAAQRERIARLDVVAPTTGVVLTEDLRQLVGARIQAGDPMLELGDPYTWRIALFVAGTDVHRIRTGDSVRVELAPFRREDRHRLNGAVRFVGPQPVEEASNPGSAALLGPRFRVEVSLDSAQVAELGRERLRRGYLAEGRIVTNSGSLIQLFWNYLQEQLDR